MSSSVFSLNCTTMVSGLAQAVAAVAPYGVGGQLPAGVNNVQISTCTATNNAITLPNSVPNGTIVKIRNDGDFFCQVFPYASGTIDGLAANVEVYVAQNGGQKSFVCNGTNTWLTIESNNVQPVFSLTASAVITGSASYAGALSKAHSNSIIVLDNSAANSTINLPAIAGSRGVQYTFVVGTSTGARSSAITPATAVMNGVLSLYIAATNGAATPTSILKADAASYLHTTTAIRGDWSVVRSDGTKWYCSGATSVAAGFS